MSRERISFYEEVLKLEPNSKLFFVLGRLYFEDDQPEKALNVLNSGLEIHPEHIQARLLLAAVHEYQQNFEAALEVHKEIFELLSGYPGFWAGLTTHLKQTGQKDPALAAAFFSSWIKDPELSWTSVIQSGLETLTKSQISFFDIYPSASQEPAGQTTISGREPPSSPPAGETLQKQKAQQTGTGTEKDLQEEFDDPEEIAEIDFQGEARTKSMAEILVAQEEFGKALDIYRELWTKSLPGQERKQLQEIIFHLEETLSSLEKSGSKISSQDTGFQPGGTGYDVPGQIQDPREQQKDGEIPESGNKDIVNFLLKLADRLEKKA